MSEPFTPSDAFGLLRSYSRHRDFVRLALLCVVQDIERRSLVHDASKMLDDEFSGFARINAIARVHKFGSEEYSASMKQEKATIDLHFSASFRLRKLVNEDGNRPIDAAHPNRRPRRTEVAAT
jgi:hypothetical protein